MTPAGHTQKHTQRTEEVVGQVLVGHQWFLQVVVGVSNVLDLAEGLKVAQQDVAEPLGVHTGDPPLLGLLILQTTGPRTRARSEITQHTHVYILFKHPSIRLIIHPSICSSIHPSVPVLLFADEHGVTATEVASISRSRQVGHQLQVVPVGVHKPRDGDDLRGGERERG